MICIYMEILGRLNIRGVGRGILIKGVEIAGLLKETKGNCGAAYQSFKGLIHVLAAGRKKNVEFIAPGAFQNGDEDFRDHLHFTGHCLALRQGLPGL